MMNTDYILIKDATENNLKHVSVKIPKRQITVVTGVSGSGKSSNIHIMKHILKRTALLTALIVGMVFPMTAQSTYVHVTIFLNDGTEASYDMQNSSYMYFEEGVKLVITESSDASSDVSYPLADIRKITCDEVEGTLEEASANIAIYPSPVHDLLHFRNVEGNHNVTIYAIDGRLVKSFQITGNQSVDISDLTSGLYLVNTGCNTLKMMKL